MLNIVSNKNKRYNLKKINIILFQKYDFILNKKIKKLTTLLGFDAMQQLIDNFSNMKSFLGLTKIIVDMDCNVVSEEDSFFKNNLLFLERITGQKSIASGHFKYIGSIKKFFFKGSVTLRKFKMITFFLFFLTCCLPIYFKRNGLVLNKVDFSKYSLKILDFNIFPNFNFISVLGTLFIKIYSDLELANDAYKLKEFLNILKLR